MVEAVHAPPPVLLDVVRLRGFTPELQRTREGERPALPRRRSTATAVYRQGYAVWRMDLTPVTRGLLDRLRAGVPLGEALAPIGGQAGASQVMSWFSAWVSGGSFAGVEVG